ncbi:MAG: MBL fold metallo-hydrolase [Candidatus Thermoplasmatota archaeon]|nr:MBL fold metallo-hydrolase [Candidatus Thermoplasmatota archaeon]
MRVKVVYDNEAVEGYKSDWGFSCLLEGGGGDTVLFDTGAHGNILLANMERARINPRNIDRIFLTHNHWDHIGGLPEILKYVPHAEIYALSSFSDSIKKSGADIREVRDAEELLPGIFTTGEMGREIKEQSMAIKTEKGIFIIAGCSHPGVENIIKTAGEFGRVYGIMGGFHGFNKFECLEGLDVVMPCHCTQYKKEIKEMHPEKCVDCGAGKVFEL